MDLQHILYGTIGTTFEEFLEPKDLLTMSEVSTTAREAPLATRVRGMFEAIDEALKLFQTNNKLSATSYNELLYSIPIRAIFKGYDYTDKEIEGVVLILYQRRHIDTVTRILIEAELGASSSAFEEMTTQMLQVSRMDYDVSEIMSYDSAIVHYGKAFRGSQIILLQELLFQASLRLRADLVKYIYSLQDNINHHANSFKYYGITKELRDLFIANEQSLINNLRSFYLFNDEADKLFIMDFSGYPDYSVSKNMLTYACRCRDRELFLQLLGDYNVDKDIIREYDAFFNDQSLYYILDENRFL